RARENSEVAATGGLVMVAIACSTSRAAARMASALILVALGVPSPTLAGQDRSDATRPRSVMRARAADPNVATLDGADGVVPVELDSSVVNLDVRVSDASGNRLTTLDESEFEVYENGERQELVHFRPITAP